MYDGTVEKLGLAKIKTGDNAGGDRLALLVRISQGEYKGAGVFHSLNMTKQGAYFVNQFLWAMTDGSETQKDAIRKMFWLKGFDHGNQQDGKMGLPITVIGSKFNPIGRKVKFITVMDNDQDGNPRAKISRFLVPVVAQDDSELDEGIGEFAPESTSNPEPKGSNGSDELDELESVGAAQDTSGAQDLDDDDPWA
jgi:hypothetical protein